MSSDLTFTAVDVETANADRASICQIGLVRVEAGEVTDTWSSLLNPLDWFDPWNTSIHGLDDATVKDSPTFSDVFEELLARLDGTVVVSHTSFDRVALERAMTQHGLALQVTWLDSASIVRRVWPDRYGRSGYGLRSVANDLGIELRHHDALEDAQAAAKIVVRVCADTGTGLENWLTREVERRARGESRVGKYGGALQGETLVFTGALRMPRREAADVAASAGSNVSAGVAKDTTILVVGIQDKTRLNGYAKSSKQRKAEALIAKGADIQIVAESDFMELVSKEK